MANTTNGEDAITPKITQVPTAPSPTSLALQWDVFSAKTDRLYMNAGTKPPGGPHRLPHRRPLRTIHCPCGGDTIVTTVIHGLVTNHVYNFAMFGSDGHGHVSRGVSHPVLARAEGLHVWGNGVVTDQPGAVLRDASGGYHAAAVSGDLHSTYYTKPVGAANWTEQQVPSMRMLALTADGTGVIALEQPGDYDVHPPDEIWATSGPASSSELPPASEVTPAEHCTGEATDQCPTGLVGFPDGTMGILLSEFPGEVSNDVDRVVLAVGRPGQPFTETTIASNGFGDSRPFFFGYARITRDPSTGELVVVDWSNVEGPGYYVWTQLPGEPWSGPVKIASTEAQAFYQEPLQIDDVVADAGEIWIGLDRSDLSAASQNGTFLIHRSTFGVWDPMIPVPGSDRYAQHSVLALNNGTLSVLYGRADIHDRVGGSGLRYIERDADGTWSSTTQFTRWLADDPVAVFPNDHARPSFAYVRR